MVNEKEDSNDAGKLGKSSTMLIVGEREIAYDFAMKVYAKFDQMIKSVVLFGSSARKISNPDSDIDIVVILDDVSVNWDEELIAWYREEMGKIIRANPYVRNLHINSVKLSTWWEDMMRGDPVIINVLRYGDALVDFGGFFKPLQILLAEGKIKSTPESVLTLLQRAPTHFSRANQSMLAVVEGLYWAMVDSAHACLIAAEIPPASPEEIPEILRDAFVKSKRLKKKHIKHYEKVYSVMKEITHGKKARVKGKILDDWFVWTDEFLKEMAKLVDFYFEKKKKET